MRLLRSLSACLALALATVGEAVAADGFMSVKDFRFAPASAQIEPGEKVDFNFEGPSPHNVIIRPGQTDRYDSGLTDAGHTKTRRFRFPGSFALYCDIHPEMKGRVTVGAPESEGPRLTRVRARAGLRKVRLTFTTSERAVVRVAIGSRRVSRTLAAGTRSVTVRRLRAGRRVATISARDGWGNRSAPVRKPFRVR